MQSLGMKFFEYLAKKGFVIRFLKFSNLKKKIRDEIELKNLG